MNKWLKRILLALGVLLVLIGGFALYIQLDGIPTYAVEPVNVKIEVTPARIERGRTIAKMLCAGCHFDQKTGALTGTEMKDAPEFGKIYSRNITKDPVHGIGAWTDGDIVRMLRTGVKKNGQYSPPWMVKLPHISDEDMASIVSFLRSDDTMVRPMQVKDRDSEPSFLTKFLCHIAFKPLPMPEKPIAHPSITDKVAYGEYLINDLVHCYGCHSESFEKMDALTPINSAGYLGGGNQLKDLVGRTLYTPNLTMDKETGLGNWQEQDFIRAVREGFKPGNKPMHYPMERFVELTPEEVSAMWAYLQTVPVIKKQRQITPEFKLAELNATEGQKIYYKYSCYTCHGQDGVGVCDLTSAGHKYSSNEELIGWIRDPSKILPGSKMPTWNGVIQENEYTPLAEYVRHLGEMARKTQTNPVSMK
jgi:mono/diheme cytochrome c family protein